MTGLEQSVHGQEPPSSWRRLEGRASRTSTASRGGSGELDRGRGARSGLGAETGRGTGAGPDGGGDSDQRPYCIYCPPPRYPLIARARGWQGTVDISLLVLADGSVDDASLHRSSGYGVLDQAAIGVARQSRFAPPGPSGLPVPLRGRIEYRFELTGLR